MKNEIYIKLLEEGTDVYRPVISESISENIYVVGQKMNNEEQWEFEPFDIVEVQEHKFQDGTISLVAIKKCLEQNKVAPSSILLPHDSQ